jgi:K+-sensing histidine kinase KdpD
LTSVSFPAPSACSSKTQELEAILDALVHGLTQPITALRGLLEVSLLGELSATECQKTVREALAQAERLSDFVSQIKEVIKSGDPGGEIEGLSWAQAVGNAVESLQPLARDREIAILLDLEEKSFVRANAEHLDSCTRGCLEIALERSPVRSAVRISLRPSGKMLMLTICDEGPPPEPDIEQFVRGRASLPNQGAPPSFAMRWWILRRMTQAQGGTARIKMLSPRGGCFELQLPQLEG